MQKLLVQALSAAFVYVLQAHRCCRGRILGGAVACQSRKGAGLELLVQALSDATVLVLHIRVYLSGTSLLWRAHSRWCSGLSRLRRRRSTPWTATGKHLLR